DVFSLEADFLQLAIDHFITRLLGRESTAQALTPIIGAVAVGHRHVIPRIEQQKPAWMLNHVHRYRHLDARAHAGHGGEPALVERERAAGELPELDVFG